jgi:membrane associated rhomboid family serine protease
VARRFPIYVPKRRAEDDPWFRVGTVDVTTTVFVIALNVFVMFIYAVSNAFFFRLILFRPLVTDGDVWRLITWPFATRPDIGAAFTLAFFWFTGREVERLFGRIRYTKFLVTIGLVTTVLALAVNVPVGGLRFVVLAVFCAFAAENPRMPFFFGIPVWVIALVYVGLDVLQYLGDRESELLLVMIGAIATALLLLRGYGWGSEVPWVPRVTIPPLLGGPTNRTKRPASAGKRTQGPKASRSRKGRDGGGSVVTGPWGEKGTGTATNAADSGPGLPRTGPLSQADVDRVLDKVAATGLNSLTEDERAVLEQASRTLRDRSSE